MCLRTASFLHLKELKTCFQAPVSLKTVPASKASHHKDTFLSVHCILHCKLPCRCTNRPRRGVQILLSSASRLYLATWANTQRKLKTIRDGKDDDIY